MPAVNPETHQPISDDPSGSDDTRGGKTIGDPALADATEQGRSGKKAPSVAAVSDGGKLPGEKASRGSVEMGG